MTTQAFSTQATSEGHPALAATKFNKELVRQLRAIDNYGSQDRKPDSEILSFLVMTKERKREIPVVGDPDEVTISRVKAFFNAVAVRLETESGKLAVPFVQLTHEGFGRVFITVGKLVVLDKTLRDVHRFGFPTEEKLGEAGERLVGTALATLKQYPKAAKG